MYRSMTLLNRLVANNKFTLLSISKLAQDLFTFSLKIPQIRNGSFLTNKFGLFSNSRIELELAVLVSLLSSPYKNSSSI